MSKASLIISVYDKSAELELIFHALSIQTFKDFEVIVAEDGINESISAVVNKWNENNIFRITHLTQPDKGFRKNKILNEAIRKSNTDYLIFIDGDCIPHSSFIKTHFENKAENTVLCGRRVNLTNKLSSGMNADKILNKEYEKIKLTDIIFSSLNRGDNDSNFNIEEAFIYRNESLRKILTNKDEHILGCNFSIHKTLLQGINGFDENYIGPGLGEDSDIEFRLRLTGTKFKSVRNLAVVYHLYHGKTIESTSNMNYFKEMMQKKNPVCENGLDKIILETTSREK